MCTDWGLDPQPFWCTGWPGNQWSHPARARIKFLFNQKECSALMPLPGVCGSLWGSALPALAGVTVLTPWGLPADPSAVISHHACLCPQQPPIPSPGIQSWLPFPSAFRVRWDRNQLLGQPHLKPECRCAFHPSFFHRLCGEARCQELSPEGDGAALCWVDGGCDR